MTLREFAKRVAGNAAVALNSTLGERQSEPMGILAYHRVVPLLQSLPEPSHNVPPERLHRQLAHLQRMGWQFVSLSQVLDGWEQGGELPRRAIIVTFDDVFESVYVHAWPILKELGIPATLFLSTAYLDSTRPFPFDPWGIAHFDKAPPESYRPIRVEQVRTMLASGLVEVGAHTHTHRNFCNQPDEFAGDLHTCVHRLKEQFGVDRAMFAYPFGRIDHGTAGGPLETAARRVGVRCALTTTPQPVHRQVDPFRWGRINVYRWDTAMSIRAKLSGWYGRVLGWTPEKAFGSSVKHEGSGANVQEQGIRQVAPRCASCPASSVMGNSRP